MPPLQSATPIALLVADIHLSLTPPIWRSNEPDWLEAMRRPLSELTALQTELNIPVLCAGDIFDRWFGAFQSAELINFAIHYLPQMYAVPGQHDLPNHNIDELKRSAFWTLCETSKIVIAAPKAMQLGTFKDEYSVRGFCWGQDIVETRRTDCLQVAIAHQYVYIPGYSYQGAPEDCNLIRKKTQFINGKWMGYDVVVFGDNHKGFKTKIGETTIYNCGGFMRRKSNEIDYKPRIGILYSNGEVEEHYLDISQDKHLETVENEIDTSDIDMDGLVSMLGKLGECGLDFKEAVKQYIKTNKVEKEVSKTLLDAMENDGRI